MLSVIFGSPDVSRAVVDQASSSGVSSSISTRYCRCLPGSHLGADGRQVWTGRAERTCRAAARGRRTRRYPWPDFRTRDARLQCSSRSVPPRNRFRCPTSTGEPRLRAATCSATFCVNWRKAIQEGRVKPVIIGPDPDSHAGRTTGPTHIPMPRGQGRPMPFPSRTAGRDRHLRFPGAGRRRTRPDSARSAWRCGWCCPCAEAVRAIPADERLVGLSRQLASWTMPVRRCSAIVWRSAGCRAGPFGEHSGVFDRFSGAQRR